MTTTLENACNLYLGELKIDLSIDIHLILGCGGHDLANDAPHQRHGSRHGQQRQGDEPILSKRGNLRRSSTIICTCVNGYTNPPMPVAIKRKIIPVYKESNI